MDNQILTFVSHSFNKPSISCTICDPRFKKLTTILNIQPKFT
jgi:hypothetical protein